jgi:hypothetical protein
MLSQREKVVEEGQSAKERAAEELVIHPYTGTTRQ